MNLACPVCHDELFLSDKSYKCENGHSFDISKSGYINLLQSNEKKSLHPGDNKECLLSRKLFLEKGFYNDIDEEIVKYINNLKMTNIQLLDLGCGEGYHTNKIYENLLNINKVYGLDISKDGINLGTKYTKDICWIVASSKNIPLLNKSMDIITALFTIINEDEIKRVLKDDGYFIHVTANSEHLIELRELLYDKVNIKDEKRNDLSFNLIDRISIKKKINLNNNEDLINLIKMTPHYYRIKKDKMDNIKKIKEIELTLDVYITIYKI